MIAAARDDFTLGRILHVRQKCDFARAGFLDRGDAEDFNPRIA